MLTERSGCRKKGISPIRHLDGKKRTRKLMSEGGQKEKRENKNSHLIQNFKKSRNASSWGGEGSWKLKNLNKKKKKKNER